MGDSTLDAMRNPILQLEIGSNPQSEIRNPKSG
jgi:hypothetical protein